MTSTVAIIYLRVQRLWVIRGGYIRLQAATLGTDIKLLQVYPS